MTVTFSRYDPTDYLRSEQDVAGYLEAAAEFDDPAFMAIAHEVVLRARKRWSEPVSDGPRE